jgi:hypothetical protein
VKLGRYSFPTFLFPEGCTARARPEGRATFSVPVRESEIKIGNSGLRNHVKHQDFRLLRGLRRSADIVLIELRN